MSEEMAGGSSPLARGLLFRAPSARNATRIIPARAGFTPRPEPRCSPHQDHPRSRGVYMSPRTIAWIPMGSSPLARGLRCHFLFPFL